MSWDPAHYLAFADQRLRPAVELLARVPAASPRRVVDLGCGAGNVTALLRERWPDAEVEGIDRSPEMLTRARTDHPELRFSLADIGTWAAKETVDVVYSNAALHWLDDHDRLLPRLLGQVSPGGFLAVQMPRNHAEPSHAIAVELAEDGPWAARTAGTLRVSPVAEPRVYVDLLAPLSDVIDVWETTYWQVLEGEDPVAAWTSGTFLTGLLDRLGPSEREAFLEAYRGRLRGAYPPRPDGTTLFPFRRLFLVARRAHQR